jgi:hypothetical protein
MIKNIWLVLVISFFSWQANGQGIQLPKTEKNKYQIFSEKPGSITLNIGNQMFNRMNTVTMPIGATVEVTVFPNFTAGPMFTYFKFVNWQQIKKSVTEIENVDVRYNQYFVGLRANYHLTPFVENLFNKKLGRDYFDLYVGAWGGYSFTNSNHELAMPQVIQITQRVRGGAVLGVRSMIVPRFGLFMELGYSSYGIGSFGCTVKLK